MHLGLPELLVVLGIGTIGLIPLAVGVWALVMLLQIRSGQHEMSRRLEAIERQVQRGTTPQESPAAR